MEIPDSTLPHGDQLVMITGNTTNPSKALILLHGRGASAANILNLVNQISLPDEYVVIAPQANENTWYPERFIANKEQNQPNLDSALDRVTTIRLFLEAKCGINPTQIILAGFSQGACLVAEYLKQYPAKHAGAAIFSGGLIGSDTEITKLPSGDLDNTPIYLGCDVADFHIPQERVKQTAKILRSLGANIDLRLYDELGHSIHPEGLIALQNMISK